MSCEELRKAASAGDAAKVRELLEAGADTESEYGTTPLAEAAENGHVEVVRELLEAGANMEAEAEGGYPHLLFMHVPDAHILSGNSPPQTSPML